MGLCLNNVEKVIFTGNLLRLGGDWNTKETNQNKNIEWLFNLFGESVSKALKLDCYPLYWNRDSHFQSSVVYNLQGLRISIESSGILYNSKKIHPEVISYLSYFFKNSLVIGVELPPFFIKVFDKLKIPYIDFMFYPARFMNDLCLGVRTNMPEVYKKLLEYELSEDAMLVNANVCKAKLSKLNDIKIAKNSALFAGQVDFDTSLVKKDGDFHNILNFKKKLMDVALNYEKLYFKPHPYQKNNEQFLDVYSSIPNAEIIEGNFYQILNNKNIRKVFALTSSVIYESKFFHTDGEWLAEYPFKFTSMEGGVFDKFKYVPIVEYFLYPSFWSDIFSLNVISETTVRKDNNYLGLNLVRKALNVDWGYGIFN